MNKYWKKQSNNHLIALALAISGLTGCATTTAPLSAPPQTSEAEMAPLETRTLETNTQPETVPNRSSGKVSKQEIEVLAFLSAWHDAWASRDIEAYLALYTPTYKGSEASPEKWQASRKRIIGQAKQIELTLGEPEITFTGLDLATAVFTQKYRAGSKSDTGTKTLKLIRKNDHWLIKQESFVAD